MDKDVLNFLLDLDQRVLNTIEWKDTQRIFNRNIDQILILMLSPLFLLESASANLAYTFTNKRYKWQIELRPKCDDWMWFK